MNAKNFDSLVRANRDYHNEQLKEAQTVHLLRGHSAPTTSFLKWSLVAILFVTVLAACVS